MQLVQLILMPGLLYLAMLLGEWLSRQKMATLFYAHSRSRPHGRFPGNLSAGNMWVHRYVYSICGISRNIAVLYIIRTLSGLGLDDLSWLETLYGIILDLLPDALLSLDISKTTACSWTPWL